MSINGLELVNVSNESGLVSLPDAQSFSLFGDTFEQVTSIGFTLDEYLMYNTMLNIMIFFAIMFIAFKFMFRV